MRWRVPMALATMMKNTAWIVVFCGSIAGSQGIPRPAWIGTLPEAPGRIYALGLAAFAPGEAQALQQAQDQARVEVLARLRASVKGETNVKTSQAYTQQLGGTSTGSTSKSISQETLVQVQATELPGLTVEETWIDREGRTAYALAYLDILVAERELSLRFGAARQNLAAEGPSPDDPRERLRKLQRMRGIQREMTLLDDLAALISVGGGDAKLRSDIRIQRQALDRQMEKLRGSLTFGVKYPPQSPSGSDLTPLVRNAILQRGLDWSNGRCDFYLEFHRSGDADPRSPRWWVYMPNPPVGFVVARGAIEIALVDALGHTYESTTLQAKGVGVNEYGADRDILKKLQSSLDTALASWLDSLVR